MRKEIETNSDFVLVIKFGDPIPTQNKAQHSVLSHRLKTQILSANNIITISL